MKKMMAGLTNYLSKAWHFPLWRILVISLTSRALSWPDGFPVCHFHSFFRSAPPDAHTPAPSLQICTIVLTGPSKHCEAVVWKLQQLSLVSVCIVQPYMISHCDFKVKEKWQTSTQTTVDFNMIGV